MFRQRGGKVQSLESGGPGGGEGRVRALMGRSEHVGGALGEGVGTQPSSFSLSTGWCRLARILPAKAQFLPILRPRKPRDEIHCSAQHLGNSQPGTCPLGAHKSILFCFFFFNLI